MTMNKVILATAILVTTSTAHAQTQDTADISVLEVLMQLIHVQFQLMVVGH